MDDTPEAEALYDELKAIRAIIRATARGLPHSPLYTLSDLRVMLENAHRQIAEADRRLSVLMRRT